MILYSFVSDDLDFISERQFGRCAAIQTAKISMSYQNLNMIISTLVGVKIFLRRGPIAGLSDLIYVEIRGVSLMFSVTWPVG